MPGYVIHLAIAEEYLRNHKNKLEEYKEFINGVLFPDSVKDKSETHYGAKSSESNLYEFLRENEINTSFKRGYFLHLLTDYLFYNKYIDCISEDIYNDYDILNDKLVEKYKIIVPKEVGNQVHSKEGKLVIVSMELVDKFILDISKMDIDEIAKDVNKNPNEWTKIRELKRL